MTRREYMYEFYKVPAELVEIGQFAKAALFGVILHFSAEDGYCCLSNQSLAEEIGRKSGKQISKYIQALQKEGWIEVIIKDGFDRHIFPTFGGS